jgi:nucleoside 2-deoxyribosyltransferase
MPLMSKELKLTGYFAGSLFSGQELYGNRLLAEQIMLASRGIVQIDLPQDLATQETGDGRGTRAADYLGMIQRDFVFANMNGPELDSGTVAEYVVASMLGMPRVQFRSDFRNVGDVQTNFSGPITVCKTTDVPYNLMLGYDESVMVFVNSMELYKASGSPEEFLNQLAIAALRGISLAFKETETAPPRKYESGIEPLVQYLKLDKKTVADIVKVKQRRHAGKDYQKLRKKLLEMYSRFGIADKPTHQY